MTQRITFLADTEDVGKRVDIAVAERVPGISRTSASNLVRDGHVSVDGVVVKPSQRLLEGSRVRVDIRLRPALSAAPEEIALNVVFRDADVAVIDKPAGLVVHPAGGHESGTLANALTALFPESSAVGDPMRPGIVHRLDKDTSGLIAVALSVVGMASLRRQIETRSASRVYLALAGGHMQPERGTIDAPIGRDPEDRRRMWVHGVGARDARTSYETLQEFRGFSYVRATLHTGRTHQIRVHFAATGHPLAGDTQYGGAALPGLKRQFLHAYRLAFASPSTGEMQSFESPLPPDLNTTLMALAAQNAPSDP